MKLLAYNVRDDEKEYFEKYSKEFGCEVTITSADATIENAKLAAGYDAISVLGLCEINKDFLKIQKENGIKVISTRTVGYNHIDLSAAKELGIQICNAGYAPNGVAEFTIMMILMCLRHYKQAMWRGQVNDFSLPGLMGRNLSELKVGILGTGKIGAQVIKNLSGFGCEIYAYDVCENEQVKELATYVDLETIYATCDIISLHMPLLPSTKHIINNETIAKMKDGVIIINCARGGLTDINALVEGIESEKIGALGMDTVEGDEDIIHADHRTDIISNRNWFYLHQFRNVIMTQHMAFYTEQAVESMVRCGVEGPVQILDGQKCDFLL